MASGITLFGEQISWYRIIGILVIGSIAVLAASTVGEFAVSVHNRYSVFPPGTDTNMYGNSLIGQMVVCLLAAVLMGYLLRKKIDVGLVSIAVVLFFVLGGLSSQVRSFIPEDWCRYELTMYRCQDQIDTSYLFKQ